jgi:hypothetical protein
MIGLLASDIVEAILAERQSPMPERLERPLSASWVEQRQQPPAYWAAPFSPPICDLGTADNSIERHRTVQYR